MTTYSSQFFAGPLIAAQMDLYVATSEYVSIVRDIELSSQAGAAINIGVWLAPAPGGQIYLVLNSAFPNATRIQWEGRLVMKTGDKIQAFSSSGSNVSCAVSGYQLTV